MGWFGLLIREIPEITVFFASDSVPQKKTKIIKSSPKQLILNPNLPIYLQLFWLVCAFFCFSKVPRGGVVFFRSVSCPFVQEAPSCPETAAGWPRSCTFFSTRKRSQQSWGPKKLGPGKPDRFFSPPKKNSQQIRDAWDGVSYVFWDTGLIFFC